MTREQLDEQLVDLTDLQNDSTPDNQFEIKIKCGFLAGVEIIENMPSPEGNQDFSLEIHPCQINKNKEIIFDKIISVLDKIPASYDYDVDFKVTVLYKKKRIN